MKITKLAVNRILPLLKIPLSRYKLGNYMLHGHRVFRLYYTKKKNIYIANYRFISYTVKVYILRPKEN